MRVRLPKKTHSIKAQKGIIHLTVQVRQHHRDRWEYIDAPLANAMVFVQPDLRGKMIYQAWPAYLGVYGEDGKVRYDEKGRAIPGNFKTIENKLPSLAQKGYTYIYVMGIYQLDKPENIKGQRGPDASFFFIA